jgi:hypothetical protein
MIQDQRRHKRERRSQAWWHVPRGPTTEATEKEGGPELMGLSPIWETQQDPVPTPAPLHPKKKKKKTRKKFKVNKNII